MAIDAPDACVPVADLPRPNSPPVPNAAAPGNLGSAAFLPDNSPFTSIPYLDNRSPHAHEIRR